MVESKENGEQTELIKRINELAKKNKSVGLNHDEIEERDQLRKKYLANFRQGFKDRIEHTKLYDKKGNEITSKEVRKVQRENGWRED